MGLLELVHLILLLSEGTYDPDSGQVLLYDVRKNAFGLISFPEDMHDMPEIQERCPYEERERYHGDQCHPDIYRAHYGDRHAHDHKYPYDLYQLHAEEPSHGLDI